MSEGRNILPAGTVLDGCYRIDRVIGLGGFGITYEAHDGNLGTHVAIKEYFPQDFGDRDAGMSVRPKSEHSKGQFEWGRTNFLQEGRTLAEFDHPGIVRVLRVFEANATAYMVMRYERGKSFSAWLKELGRKPTQAELDRIAGPLLDVLALLHARNFLHRDIAPDNVIVREDGTPVLLDFGSARRVIAEMSRMLTGIVKAGYSPQEQYASDNRLQGPWTDIYAFGGTLYRAIAGRAPMEAMLRFDGDPMEKASTLGAGAYRASFLEAIDACLEVRPSQRPQSVAELRARLLPGTEPVTAATAIGTRLPDMPTRISTVAPAAAGTALGSLWSRLNPKHVVAASLVVAGCAAAVLVFAATSGSRSPVSAPVETRQPASRAFEEAAREAQRRADEEAERRQRAEVEAEEQRRAQEDAERRQRAEAEEAERLRQKQLADEDLRRQAERAEEERKRQAALEEAERQKVAAEAERKRQAEAARLKREADAAAAAAAASRAQAAKQPTPRDGGGSKPGTGGTCGGWMFYGSSCTDAGGRWCTQTPGGRRCS